jgi:preprotein translocase subunit SecE
MDFIKSVSQRSVKFLSEVKKEVSQVVWPTRKETNVTTIVICVFAIIMSLYLWIVDRGILFVIRSIMG